MPAKRTETERFWKFWEYVDQNDPSGCWLWMRHRDPNGYGRFGMGGKPRLTHRLAYEICVGPIPPGLDLDHLCRNPPCCNPAHLEPVTHAENIRRGNTYAQGAPNRAKTHCVNGHEFTPENTYVTRDGRERQCRVCRRAAKRRSYYKTHTP